MRIGRNGELTLPRGEPPLIVEGLFSFELGGSERVGADVALECARRGYRVLCFAFYGSDGPVRRELEANSIVCMDLNYLKRARFVRRFTYQLALIQFFRRQCSRYPHPSCNVLNFGRLGSSNWTCAANRHDRTFASRTQRNADLSATKPTLLSLRGRNQCRTSIDGAILSL